MLLECGVGVLAAIGIVGFGALFVCWRLGGCCRELSLFGRSFLGWWLVGFLWWDFYPIDFCQVGFCLSVWVLRLGSPFSNGSMADDFVLYVLRVGFHVLDELHMVVANCLSCGEVDEWNFALFWRAEFCNVRLVRTMSCWPGYFTVMVLFVDLTSAASTGIAS